MGDDTVVEWLLEGDPAIRWQVLRDLVDEPAHVWEAERRRTVETGWVAALLAAQGRDGEWPPGRWTASTWTLLLLVAVGLPEGHPAARAPLERLLDRFMPPGEEVDGAFLLRRVDTRRSTCSRASGSRRPAGRSLSRRSASRKRGRSSSCSRTGSTAPTGPAR